MKQTPPPRLPAARQHTRTRAHVPVRPAPQPAVSGAGPARHTQPRAAQSGARADGAERSPAPAPPPGGAPGGSAGGTARPARPAGLRGGAAAAAPAAEGASGRGSQAGSADQVGPAGRRRVPGGRERGAARALRAGGGSGWGERSGPPLRPCAVSALPGSRLLFLSLPLLLSLTQPLSLSLPLPSLPDSGLRDCRPRSPRGGRARGNSRGTG